MVEARDVESLCGGDRDGDARFRAVQRQGRDVAPAVEDEVAVDFVRDQGHAVLLAQVQHGLQRLALPDAAAGIVRRAQEHEPALRKARVQVRKVHLVPAGRGLHEGIFHDLALGPADDAGERPVDRGLDQHLVPGRGQRVHGEQQGVDHARGEEHLLPAQLHAVAAGVVVDDGLLVRVAHARIAEDRVLQALAQRLQDARRTGEVHVRDPHGQHALGRGVPLQALGAAAVNARLQREIHILSSFLFPLAIGVQQRIGGAGVRGKVAAVPRRACR